MNLSRTHMRRMILVAVLLAAPVLTVRFVDSHFFETSDELESVYFQDKVLLGTSCSTPTPTQEIRERLRKLVRAHPTYHRNLADIEVLLSDFSQAEKDLLEFVRISREDTSSLHELASFYHQRLRYPDEIRALEKITTKKTYYEIIDLIKDNLLEDFDKYQYYKKMMADFPEDTEIMKDYIDELTADKHYSRALGELDHLRDKLDDTQYFLKAKAEILLGQGKIRQAVQVYTKELAPTTPQEIFRDYIHLLKAAGTYNRVKKDLVRDRSKSRLDFVTLLHIYLNERDWRKAKDLLNSWAEATKLSQDDLQILGGFYSRLGYHDLASKCYYTLYLVSPADSNLHKLFTAVNSSGKKHPFASRTWLLNHHFDRNPSIYGGIVSLLLNDTEFHKRSNDLNGVLVRYSNHDHLHSIYSRLEGSYPESKYIPELLAILINEIEEYEDHELVIKLCREFATRFPDHPKYYDIRLKQAESYGVLGRENDRWKVYNNLLDVASRRKHEAEYARVMRKYMHSLTQAKKYLEVIRLYWKEIEKHPNQESLYEEFLRFIGRHNLYDEELKVYEKAVRHFDKKSWYHKLARWYVRHRSRQSFEDVTMEIRNVFDDTELDRYLDDFVHFDWKWRNSAKSQFYLKMYLYAHRRFPRNLDFVKGLLRFYDRFYGYYRNEFEVLSLQYFMYDAHVRTGLLRHMLNEKRLRKTVQQLLQKKKRHTAETCFLAHSLAWLSRHESAQPAFEELASFYPGNAEIGEQLGDLYRSLQHTEKSAEQFAHLSPIYPHNKNYYIKSGEVWAEAGYFQKASYIWDQILKITPGNVDNYLEVATVNWDYYQFDRAVDILKKVRDVKNDPFLYAKQLAAVYESMEDYASACREYVASVSKEPWGYENIRIRLKYIAEHKGLEPAIRQSFESLIEKSPKNPWVITSYGDFLHRMGKENQERQLYERYHTKYEGMRFLEMLWDRATSSALQERLLKRMIEISPRKRHYYLRLANFYETVKNYRAATKTYQQLMKEYKDEPAEYMSVLKDAWEYYWRIKEYGRALTLQKEAVGFARGRQRESLSYQLAQKYIELKEHKEAAQILKQLIDEHPTNTPYFNTLAQVYTELDDVDGLVSLYKQGIKNVRKSSLDKEVKKERIAELRFGLVECYSKLEMYTEAQDQYIEIINRLPLNREYSMQGYEFSKKQRLGKRIFDFYKKTSEKSFKDYRWNIVLASFCAADGDLQSAVEEYKKAIENEPQRISLFVELADLYLKLGNDEDAILTYEEAYKLDENKSKWIVKIADMYSRTGDTKKARDWAGKLIEGNPPEFSKYFQLAKLLESWGMSGVEYLDEGMTKFVRNPYRENLEHRDLEDYIRIQLKSGNYVKVFDRLLALQNLLIREMKKEPNFERRKVQRSLSSVRHGVSSVLAQNVVVYAEDSDKHDIMEVTERYFKENPGVPFESWDLYIRFARTAKLASLEESLITELMNYCFSRRLDRPYKSKYRAMVRALQSFFEQRKAFSKAIELLKNERQRGAGYIHSVELGLANLYRIQGDTENEIGELGRYYASARGRSRHFKSSFRSRDGHVEKYFTLLLKNGRVEDLENLAEKHNAYTGQFLNFLIRNDQMDLALKTIDGGCRPQPPVWKNSKKALVYLFFKVPDSKARDLFIDFLDIMPIGERIERQVDRQQSLISRDWYIFGKRYGEFLKIAEDESYPKYLVSMVEDLPKNHTQQESVGDFYSQNRMYDKAIYHYSLAQSFRPLDNMLFAKIGEAYLGKGEERRAHQEWTKITKKDGATLADYEFYYQTLDANGFGARGLEAYKAKIREVFVGSGLNAVKRHLINIKVDRGLFKYLKSLYGTNPGNLQLAQFIIDEELADPEYFYSRVIGFLTSQKEPNKRLIEHWRKRYLEYCMENKKYRTALNIISALSAQYETSQRWLVEKRIRVLIRMGKMKDAIAKLKRMYSTKVEQDYLQAIGILESEGRKEEAKEVNFEFCTYMIEMRSQNSVYYATLAELYLERKKEKAALELLENMVLLRPDNREGLKSAAEVLAKFDLNEEAAKYRQRLATISPDDWDNKFELYRLSEDIKGMKSLLDERRAPNSVKEKVTHFRFPQREVKYFKKSKKTAHKTLILARLYKAKEDLSRYEKTLLEACNQIPVPYQICLEQARFYDDKRGVDFYKKCLYADPTQRDVNFSLFDIYYADSSYTIAVEMIKGINIERADMDTTEKVALLSKIVDSYSKLGAYKDALSYARLEKRYNKEAEEKVAKLERIISERRKEEEETPKIRYELSNTR